MISTFYCPECKNELILLDNFFLCNNCKIKYSFKNGIGSFPVSIVQNQFNDKIRKLILKIQNTDYNSAIENFVNQNEEFRTSLTYTKYDRSIDSIFHCIGKSTERCLEINSGLGNKTESLSNIFNNVFSIELNDDFLEFQKIRFNQKNCKNIFIGKSDIFKLPFPDNYFDLVLGNDIINSILKMYNGNALEIQNKLLKELKRVINSKGKIVFGIDKNLSSTVQIKKYNLKNKSKNVKQSYSYFQNLFKNNGLYTKSYWVVPSYEKPYFSGKIKDELSLKWFFTNLENMVGKQNLSFKKQVFLSLIRKINYVFMQKLLEIFSPSIIFCCGKIPIEETFEDWIERDTNYQNYTMISRRMKIFFVLLNKKGIPEKLVSIKRYGNSFPEKLENLERNYPKMNDPQKRAWIEEWFSGHSLNPLNLNEVTKAIDWLAEFQNNSKHSRMKKNDIQEEIDIIKKGLQYVNHGDLNQYYRWLEDYRKIIEGNEIFKTAIHGDFWITNILINEKSKKIYVLDWELFREKGNPFLDFLTFLYDLMSMTEDNPLETFKKNLKGEGSASNIINHVKLMMEEHFGFKIEIKILLRYYLIRKMIPKEHEMKGDIINRKQTKNEPTLYMKMLDILSK